MAAFPPTSSAVSPSQSAATFFFGVVRAACVGVGRACAPTERAAWGGPTRAPPARLPTCVHGRLPSAALHGCPTGTCEPLQATDVQARQTLPSCRPSQVSALDGYTTSPPAGYRRASPAGGHRTNPAGSQFPRPSRVSDEDVRALQAAVGDRNVLPDALPLPCQHLGPLHLQLLTSARSQLE